MLFEQFGGSLASCGIDATRKRNFSSPCRNRRGFLVCQEDHPECSSAGKEVVTLDAYTLYIAYYVGFGAAKLTTYPEGPLAAA